MKDMNLVLMEEVRLESAIRSFAVVTCRLDNYGKWQRIRDRGYGSLSAAVAAVQSGDRWWLEGRNYGELPEKEA